MGSLCVVCCIMLCIMAYLGYSVDTGLMNKNNMLAFGLLFLIVIYYFYYNQHICKQKS